MSRGTSRRHALWSTALFGGGLALAVLPWTARNYSLSGRLIPVNDQGWAVVWGSTTKPLGIHPNHYKWYSLLPELSQVYLRVSGRPDFDYLTYVRANAAYEAAFRDEALRNLRRSPGTYLVNAVSGVVSFCLDINSVFLEAWEYRQATGVPPPTSWFIVGHAQSFHPGGTRRPFAAWAGLMTALAAGGLYTDLDYSMIPQERDLFQNSHQILQDCCKYFDLLALYKFHSFSPMVKIL